MLPGQAGPDSFHINTSRITANSEFFPRSFAAVKRCGLWMSVQHITFTACVLLHCERCLSSQLAFSFVKNISRRLSALGWSPEAAALAPLKVVTPLLRIYRERERERERRYLDASESSEFSAQSDSECVSTATNSTEVLVESFTERTPETEWTPERTAAYTHTHIHSQINVTPHCYYKFYFLLCLPQFTPSDAGSRECCPWTVVTGSVTDWTGRRALSQQPTV